MHSNNPDREQDPICSDQNSNSEREAMGDDGDSEDIPEFTHQQWHHVIDMAVDQYGAHFDLQEHADTVGQKFKNAFPIVKDDEHIVVFSRKQVRDLMKTVAEECIQTKADYSVVQFGKHKGKPFALVHREHQSYCNWIVQITSAEPQQCAPGMLEFGKWLHNKGSEPPT